MLSIILSTAAGCAVGFSVGAFVGEYVYGDGDWRRAVRNLFVFLIPVAALTVTLLVNLHLQGHL